MFRRRISHAPAIPPAALPALLPAALPAVPAAALTAAIGLLAAAGQAQVIDFRDLAPEAGVTQPALPSPDAVIERHLELTGGRAAYERIENRRSAGTLVQSNQDGVSRVIIHDRAPGLRHVRLELGGGATREYVTNRDESWTYDGDIVVASGGDQRVQEIRRAVFNMLLDWRATFALAKTIGVEPVYGRPAYKVRLLAEDCHAVFLYFDVETARLVRTVQDIAYAGDTIRADARMSAFERIDGIDVPMKTRRELQYRGTRFVQEYELTEVEHNVEMADAMFATPPELRAEPIGEGGDGDGEA